MKTILVLTDFSENAIKATDAAIHMADKTGAEILLFNAYVRPVFTPAAGLVPWPEEYYSAAEKESSSQLKTELARIQKVFSEHHYTSRSTNLHSLNLEGSLGENVQAILKEKDVIMIVMGARDKVTGDFIFGSDINDVLGKVNCPVLLVPKKETKLDFKTVIFATDLADGDIGALKWLNEFSNYFGFHMHVCHVSAPTQFIPDFNEEDKVAGFANEISCLALKNVSFKDLQGKNIVNELEKFSEENQADLLALVYKKHAMLWRLFHQTPARTLIEHQKNPLLILPENWKHKNIIPPLKKKAEPVKRKRVHLL